MCFGSKSRSPAPPPPRGPSTFAYGPKGVEKTAVSPTGDPRPLEVKPKKKKEADTSNLNIPRQDNDSDSEGIYV